MLCNWNSPFLGKSKIIDSHGQAVAAPVINPSQTKKQMLCIIASLLKRKQLSRSHPHKNPQRCGRGEDRAWSRWPEKTLETHLSRPQGERQPATSSQVIFTKVMSDVVMSDRIMSDGGFHTPVRGGTIHRKLTSILASLRICANNDWRISSVQASRTSSRILLRSDGWPDFRSVTLIRWRP